MNTVNTFETPDYKKSRTAYVIQCTVEYFVTILASDAYLAKLTASVGMSDSLTGIISTFSSFAFLFGLINILLMEFRLNIKRTVMIFDTLSQVFFFGLFLVPFLPVSQSVKSILIMAFVLIAYSGKYIIASMYFKWANSFVPPEKRARFSATKEMISLISGIAFTLGIGFCVDKLEGSGNLTGAFLLIAIMLLVLNVANFISLSCIHPEVEQKNVQKTHHNFGDVLSHTFGNKAYCAVLAMLIIADFGKGMTIGFLGTFKTKELLLSVGSVQLINMVGNLARFLISRPMGAYSDKHSFASGYRLAMCLSAVGFLANIFTTPKTWWCIIIYSLFYMSSVAGTNQNASNIIYSYVEKEYIVQALALKSAICGMCTFIASLVGSRILAAVQANGNTVFGIPLYGQQLLSAISFVFIVADIFFIVFVVEKQTAKIQ